MIFKKLLEFYKQGKGDLKIFLYLSDDSIDDLKAIFAPLKLDVAEFKIKIIENKNCELYENELVGYDIIHPLIKYFSSTRLKAKVNGYYIAKNDDKFECYLKLESPDIEILKETLQNYFNCENKINDIKLELKISNDYKSIYDKVLNKINDFELYFDKIKFEKEEFNPLKSILKLKG
jgi:hypothetical protein